MSRNTHLPIEIHIRNYEDIITKQTAKARNCIDNSVWIDDGWIAKTNSTMSKLLWNQNNMKQFELESNKPRRILYSKWVWNLVSYSGGTRNKQKMHGAQYSVIVRI